MRISHYDAGTELTYDVSSVEAADKAKVCLVVEKFVGGGFAGQVYRVKITGIEGDIEGLEVGQIRAIKILIPPSGFSLLFRNMVYWIGFQGPFQLQVNPTAARAGALWQKFIRRGAKIRFGDENAVVDICATFVDDGLGSCGELSEWVDGRTWRLASDSSWKGAATEQDGWEKAEFDDTPWQPALVLGPVGIEPWGSDFLKNIGVASEPRRPLAIDLPSPYLTCFDEVPGIVYDIKPRSARRIGWYRFVAPPGLRRLELSRVEWKGSASARVWSGSLRPTKRQPPWVRMMVWLFAS